MEKRIGELVTVAVPRAARAGNGGIEHCSYPLGGAGIFCYVFWPFAASRELSLK